MTTYTDNQPSRDLVKQDAPAPRWLDSPPRALSPIEISRVAMLEREAPRTVELAAGAGVTIAYVGISYMFDEARRYSGTDGDWIVAPAGPGDDIVAPAAERSALRTLRQAGLDFPAIYVAHELAETTQPAGDGPTSVDREIAAALVGPVPAPVASVELGNRLSDRTARVIVALRATLPMAGMVLAAPFVLAGSAIGALVTVDPIVFGVIPAVTTEVGAPGAWFILARWDW
jgi:hypothetical protein